MGDAIREIRNAEDAIYEIQELRHASSSTHTTQINELFTAVEAQVEQIRRLVSQPGAASAAAGTHDNDDRDEEEGDRSEPEEVDPRTQEAWAEFQKRWERLKEEMKEDGWLVRFRTTAEQAEAMMDSLSKSSSEMSDTVRQHESGQAVQDGQTDLVRLLKSHLAMRSTYATSISKILKMMDRSLADRATKNGEALRRHGDMVSRWSSLQRELSTVEGRARIVLEQQSSPPDGSATGRKGGKGAYPTDDVEQLVESLTLQEDVRSMSGYDTLGSRRTRVHTSQLGPTSSSSSLASRGSEGLGNGFPTRSTLSPPGPPISGSRYPSLGSSAHPGGQTLRRRVSQTSLVSTNTAATTSERPRWNASTKVNNTTAAEQTAGTAKRRLTMNGTTTTPSRPSRSGATTPTFAVPAGTTPSRIPVPKPRPSNTHRMSMGAPPVPTLTPRRSIPGLAVSTTSSRITLSNPSGPGRGDDIPPVPALPNLPARTPSRQTHRSSMASDASGVPPAPHFSRATTTPRNPRQSLASSARGPPSAYRNGPPTPSSGIPPVPRPSSRMSTGAASVAGSACGFLPQHHDDLTPFVPSKYDLLDTNVTQILEDNAFEHFVARVDPSLKKGQRRGENEEWKGMFVFGGPAEKGTPVKMMQLAGRDGGKVSKVLARRAGQWVPLVEILNERKGKYDEVF